MVKGACFGFVRNFTIEAGYETPTHPGATWTKVSLGREYTTNQPELASRFKAAVIKLMIPYIASRSERLDKAATPISAARRQNACALAEFMNTLDKAGFWLNDQEAASAIAAGTKWLETWHFLAQQAVRDNEHRWKIRPKHHYFEHMKDDMHTWRANPVKLQCFAPETFMGRIKQLGLRCHGLTVLQRMPQRLIIAYAVRWAERRRLNRWIISAG